MPLSNADREALYTTLSRLIGAGFPAAKSVRTLRDHKLPTSQRLAVVRLDEALQLHYDFASALEDTMGSDAAELDVAVIRAGQDGGRLPESLDTLATYYRQRHQTNRAVRTQLIYPAILLHLGVLLPCLPKLIAEPGLAPLLTALAVLAGLWILLFAGLLTLRRLNRIALHSRGADCFLNRIPLYGKMRRHSALSRFTAVLGFFLSSGRTVSASLRAGGRASGSGTLLNTAEEAARDIEHNGNTLSGAIADRRGIPKPLKQGIRTAELSGGLDTEMQRWSKHHAEMTEEAARALGTWVPRFIYLIVVLAVAWQIIQTASAVYAPVFEMLDQM
jgi:type II secretory pathway component PulF